MKPSFYDFFRSRRFANTFAFILGLFLVILWLDASQPLFFGEFYKNIPLGLNKAGGPEINFLGGDHVQIYYLSWKLKDAILNQVFSPFVDAYNFATNTFVFLDLHVGFQFITTALSMIALGNPAGYNFGFVLLPLLLTFASGYFLAAQLVNSLPLRLASGLFLTMIPSRLHQIAGGHSGGVIMLFIPFYFGALIANSKQSQRKYDVIAATSLFLAVISDEHIGYYLLLCSMFIFATWFIQDSFASSKPLTALKNLFRKWWVLFMGAMLSVGYGVLVSKFLLADDGVPRFKRKLHEVRNYSAGIDEFFIWPNDLGILVIAAIIVGIFILAITTKRWRPMWRSPFLGFFIAAVVCTILMVGVGGHWSQQSGLYNFFFKHMPYFSKQRVPVKMFSTAATLYVVLCLYLFGQLMTQVRQLDKRSFYRKLSFAGVGVLYLGLLAQPAKFFLSGNHFMQFENMERGPHQIFDYLKKNTTVKDIIVIQPTSDSLGRYETMAQYFATQTGRRFFQGYHANPPSSYFFIANALSSFSLGRPSRDAMSEILKQGFTYILHYRGAPDSMRPEILNQSIDRFDFLEKAICEENFCLYRIDTKKIVVDNYSNHGLTGYQSFKGVPGIWMMHESNLLVPPGMTASEFDDFKVVSVFEVPGYSANASADVRVDIDFRHRMDLWVLQPGQKPIHIQELNLPRNEEQPSIVFSTSSRFFCLATRESWTPSQVGAVGTGEFSVFIKNVSSVRKK